MAFYDDDRTYVKKPTANDLKELAVEWASLISQFDAISLDTESCGGRKEDEIISLGICRVSDGKQLFYSTLKPSRIAKFNPYATKVHGIQERDLRNSPSIGDVWEEINSIIQFTQIVAYSESADRRMLVQTLNNHGIEVPELNWHCSMKKYKEYSGKRVSLTEACRQLNIKAGGHNALEDAIANARLIYRMARRYEPRK